MPKFAYHNCSDKTKADIILIGVPDESASYAGRHGSSKGPDAIRKASTDFLCFKREGKTVHVEPERGSFDVKLCDAGNIPKASLQSFLESLSKAQTPILLGGDHSNTYLAVKALCKKHKKIAIVYLDAHPDIISSTKLDFGSVVSDILRLKEVDHKKVILLGIRSIELEEKINLKKEDITSFTALDVYEQGVKKVFSKVKKMIGDTPVYLSIDLDVLDPAFAPGVCTPAPFGLNANAYISLVKDIASLNIVAFDIMELAPKFDKQQMTAHIAAQSVIEILGSRRKD